MPSTAPPAAETWYRLCPAHTIVSTGGDWDRFARENDAPELVPGPVGSSVYDHMDGEEVRDEFRRLLDSVAASGRPVETRFRCDSPGLCRLLQLRVDPEDDGGFRLTSRILSVERRPTVSLLDRWQPRTDAPPLTVCAWCRRGEMDGAWLELDELEARLGLRDDRTSPQVSHTICHACSEQLLDDLDRVVPEDG